jgi:hypothetical protein
MIGPFPTRARLVIATLFFSCVAATAQQIVPQNESTQPAASATQPGTAVATAPQAPQPPQELPPTAPDWASHMTPEEQRYIEQVLDYWQTSSQKIHQCTCDFTRWSYDSEFCNYRNPQTNELCAYAVRRGVIKYASPDKAFLDTTETWHFDLSATQKPDLKKS